MGASTSDERFYKRKLNEFDQELKRLQKELAKLKVLRRNGGRARKQLVRSMQREMELTAVFDDIQAQEFEDIQPETYHEKKQREDKETLHCKDCQSHSLNMIGAGLRTIIVCLECESRYTVKNEEFDELAKSA